jgi:uncharacterized protein YndB with AHSA1/START domain
MTRAAKSSFVYVTYIKATPERLWEALISPEFATKYWLGNRPEAEWKVGGAWKLVFPNGTIADVGEITAFDPPKLLSIRWRNEWAPELNAEGWSVCTMELEQAGKAVKPNFHTWHLAQSGNPRNTARFAKPYNIVVLNREMFWPKIRL